MNPRIQDWRNQRVWVIGASSGIGAETARLLLQKGARVMLSARRLEQLLLVTDAVRQSSTTDHPAGQALTSVVDVTEHATVLAARDAMLAAWGGIDLVLVVAGSYNEMRADQFDLAAARSLVNLNVMGVFNCLDAVLPTLLAQGSGAIGLVSSVAGFRGLPKALIYGPTKAAVINLAECLYLDLRPRGIGVSLINPGFVDTPLTANNDFSMPGLMSAADAAGEIVRGLERGQFHIHFPRSFTNWLRLARLLPYSLYFWLIHKGTGL